MEEEPRIQGGKVACSEPLSKEVAKPEFELGHVCESRVKASKSTGHGQAAEGYECQFQGCSTLLGAMESYSLIFK